MYKHVWSVLCASSTIDQDSQNITLNNVVESIGIDPHHEKAPEGLKDALESGQKVNLQFQMELVSFITTDSPEKESDLELTIDLFDPDGQSLGTFNPKMKFEKDIKRMKNRTKISGIALTTGGIYNFIVSMPPKPGKDPEPVAEIPLAVDIKAEA